MTNEDKIYAKQISQQMSDARYSMGVIAINPRRLLNIIENQETELNSMRDREMQLEKKLKEKTTPLAPFKVNDYVRVINKDTRGYNRVFKVIDRKRDSLDLVEFNSTFNKTIHLDTVNDNHMNFEIWTPKLGDWIEPTNTVIDGKPVMFCRKIAWGIVCLTQEGLDVLLPDENIKPALNVDPVKIICEKS